MNPRHLCNRIKSIREEKKIKQLDIAIQLGIEQSTYAKIEGNQIKISVERLIKLSEILKVPVNNFFSDVNSRQENQPASLNHIEQLFENQNKLILEQLSFMQKLVCLIDIK